jgi:acylphosphatase
VGLSPESILRPGQRARLHPVATVATGGEGMDITDDVHPDFARIAVQATRIFRSTPHAGLDLLAPDIRRPAAEQDWAICEVNLNPALGLHHFPMHGTARDTAGALIEHLFPKARIVQPQDYRKVHLVCFGKVAGVDFPNWLRRSALLRGVVGTAREANLGTVEAVLCGAPNAVADLAELCRAGPPGAKPEGITASEWTGSPPDTFTC